MKVTGLTRKNGHLALHRRTILARSIGAGAAGLMPIPLLDEWMASTVRRGTIRLLAEARSVDLDEAAVRAIADGRTAPPTWRDLLGSKALGLLSRTLRRALFAWAIARRAEHTRKSFAVATLFDHYCARLHVGAGLDADQGYLLRDAIDEAIARTRTGLTERVFSRAVAGAGRGLVRAPVRAANALTGGWVRRLLSRRDEAAAEEVVEEALTTGGQEGNVFVRVARRVDDELSAAGNAWQDDLVSSLERAWRARRPESAP